MQITQSNEKKRCSNYDAKEYEKQIGILRRKLDDAETQRANVRARSLMSGSRDIQDFSIKIDYRIDGPLV